MLSSSLTFITRCNLPHTHTHHMSSEAVAQSSVCLQCIVPPRSLLQCQHVMAWDPTEVSQRPPAHRAEVLRVQRTCCCSSPGASHGSAAVRLAERAHAQRRAYGWRAVCVAGILSGQCVVIGLHGAPPHQHYPAALCRAPRCLAQPRWVGWEAAEPSEPGPGACGLAFVHGLRLQPN